MIEFNNIQLNFNGKKIIHNLSFTIAHGDKVVLLGKSGSGKSSLLSLLLGFIVPGQGEIIFDGLPVDKKSVWAIRKKIAYVDQAVSMGEGSVADFINFITQLNAVSAQRLNKGKIGELLNYFELGDDITEKEIKELSGGERQRVAIVIAIALGRNIFLLDEVTSSLDMHLKKKVADYFLAREEWTCLVISHDAEWLDSPAVKVFDVEEGRWRL
ncbi:MAG: hypothetical protein B6I36_01715 [Desulfobacteraceae bacterium 4572_35.1]|nr:MAG: hypothetical protein B6I36_01715 [Desulfobacteraceae bacterium 4572_35.1]